MNDSRELTVLLNTIQAAGEAIIKIQQKKFHVIHKANQDPLTEADLLANEILKQQLLGSFPEDGWLSEETIDNNKRLSCKRVWLVDPIDGTKEFVKGIPEFAISVALVENGKPILAAIYNPMTEQLFHALKNQGAWLNGKPIHGHGSTHSSAQSNTPSNAQTKLKILASRTEMSDGTWSQFINDKNIDVQPIGSIAYKLGLVAAGIAHSTFSLGPKSEWDIAAGVLLIEEAGGVVTDKTNQPFKFNLPNIRVNGIIAASKESYQQINQLIQKAQNVQNSQNVQNADLQ